MKADQAYRIEQFVAESFKRLSIRLGSGSIPWRDFNERGGADNDILQIVPW
ncbi:MAG: hypothetical protein ABSA46_12340 [Thermodesulfovibrionales bacterium]